MTRPLLAQGRIANLLADATFAFMLTALSALQALRVVGPVAALGLLPFFALLTALACQLLRAWMGRKSTTCDAKWSHLGVVALALFLVVSFAVLYPLAKSGIYGPGSDRDDALTRACAALRSGRYPYSTLTYLNNPISPMPGELMLAMPFAWLGCVALQNLFWAAVFYTVLRTATGRASAAVAVCCLLLFGSPEVLRELVTGGDLGTTALMVLSTTYLLCKTCERPGHWWIGSAILLGLSLSSRPVYLMLVPILGARLLAILAWPRAVLVFALILGAFALVTLPFYLANPAGFTPLSVSEKLGALRALFPFADTAIYFVTAFAAVLGACCSAWRSEIAFFWTCGLVMALPLWLGEIVQTLGQGSVSFTFFPYLHVAVYFLAVAWAMDALRIASPAPTPS